MIKILVPGGLNIDIVASNVDKIAVAGELVVGEGLKIGPGGKSRNIAQMIAVLSDKNTVAMIGKTAHDPFGFWKIPVDALVNAGVDISQVKILEFAGVFPGVALIPVDREGNNQIYLLPGINNDFTSQDIDDATALFHEAARGFGIVVLSMELPLSTALYVLDKAERHGLRTVLDPGGIQEGVDYAILLRKNIFLLKPNQHETEILSGIKVIDLESAKLAAKIFMEFGIKNVFITAGARGAYLVTESSAEHILIPEVKDERGEKDETGCGDQTAAATCALLAEGKSVAAAARVAIIAGTLQFHRSGIVPVTKEDLSPYMNSF